MTQHTTTPETAKGKTQDKTRAIRHGRARRRVVALLMSLAAVLGLSVLTSGSAQAFVSYPNQFYAECSPSAVTALSPDMRYFPDYAVSWNAKLYVWTTYGWSRYGTSSTQTTYGTNMAPAFSAWYPQQSATWYSLPRGRYYQVRVTATWWGASTKYVNDAPVPHQLAQGNFNLTQKSYSTTSYCYIP